MNGTNTIIVIFALIALLIILGIATYSQFEKMKMKKFKGEEKSEGKVSTVIALGDTITKE